MLEKCIYIFLNFPKKFSNFPFTETLIKYFFFLQIFNISPNGVI